MQHDDRDERQERDQEADEFETATWPRRDIPEDTAAADGPAAEADPAEADPVDADASDRDTTVTPEPPPPDVEAHAPTPDATEPAMPAHSVPATEPGESTLCPRCGTENRPGLSFCRSCGQRLVAAGAPATVTRPAPPDGTQACPRCGTHNRTGTTFCQNCGANLRPAAEGYVPPAVATASATAAGDDQEPAERRALLGPIVLLIGAAGLATAWLLPFLLVTGSLYDASFGSTDGYGIAFWSAYDSIATLAEQAYFGFAAPTPLLIVLLVVLAIAGILRPAPGMAQRLGLLVAIVWAVGLAVLFVIVEVLGGGGEDLLGILRALSPAGIIFLLASLIVLIGALTRYGRA